MFYGFDASYLQWFDYCHSSLFFPFDLVWYVNGAVVQILTFLKEVQKSEIMISLFNKRSTGRRSTCAQNDSKRSTAFDSTDSKSVMTVAFRYNNNSKNKNKNKNNKNNNKPQNSGNFPGSCETNLGFSRRPRPWQKDIPKFKEFRVFQVAYDPELFIQKRMISEDRMFKHTTLPVDPQYLSNSRDNVILCCCTDKALLGDDSASWMSSSLLLMMSVALLSLGPPLSGGFWSVLALCSRNEQLISNTSSSLLSSELRISCLSPPPLGAVAGTFVLCLTVEQGDSCLLPWLSAWLCGGVEKNDRRSLWFLSFFLDFFCVKQSASLDVVNKIVSEDRIREKLWFYLNFILLETDGIII